MPHVRYRKADYDLQVPRQLLSEADVRGGLNERPILVGCRRKLVGRSGRLLTEAEGQLRAGADSRGATDISPSDAEYRTIDHDYPLAIATLVRNAGAASFALTSSAGADARSRFAYTRLKGELEDAIEHLGFPSLTVARPGFLGGARSEHRSMEQAMNAILRIAAPVLPASARINPASSVAALLVEAALDGRGGKRIIRAAEIARTAEERR